jgi:formate--tetrahydrofolate ligase
VVDIIANNESGYAPIYDVNDTIQQKIETIAKTVYGAGDVSYTEEALETIKIFIANGWDRLPVCMAKTPLSLTDDPKIQGRPKDFTIHVSDLSISRGAGFIVAYTGSILTMPGLPKVPAAIQMGVDENGESYGIF